MSTPGRGSATLLAPYWAAAGTVANTAARATADTMRTSFVVDMIPCIGAARDGYTQRLSAYYRAGRPCGPPTA